MKEIAQGVYAIETEMDRFGQKSMICPLLVRDSDSAVSIDAGLARTHLRPP